MPATPANIGPILQVYPKLSLQLDGEKLVADLHPAKEPLCLTRQQLEKEISRIEMADLSFDRAAVNTLLQQARLNDTFSIPIATKIDALLTTK